MVPLGLRVPLRAIVRTLHATKSCSIRASNNVSRAGKPEQPLQFGVQGMTKNMKENKDILSTSAGKSGKSS